MDIILIYIKYATLIKDRSIKHYWINKLVWRNEVTIVNKNEKIIFFKKKNEAEEIK